MISQTEKPAWSVNALQKDTLSLFLAWINEGEKVRHITNCPGCKSTDFTEVSGVDRFGCNFKACLCEACGLVFTNPQIKEEFLAEYYNRFYHPLVIGKKEVQQFLFNRNQGVEIFKTVHKYVDQKFLSVFEVGAGSGSNLVSFKDEANKKNIECSLYGLEYNEAYVRRAKEYGVKLDAKSLKDYVEQQDMPEKFDVIILSHVFEHIVDTDDFLKDISKLMHTNSILFIEVPGVLRLHKSLAYNASFASYLVHAHIYHFTASSLNNTVCRSNFKNIYTDEVVRAVYKKEEGFAYIVQNSAHVVKKYLHKLEKYKKLYRLIILIRLLMHRVKHKLFA